MTMRNRVLAPLTAATMLSAAALAGCGGSSDKAGGAQQPAPTVLTMVNALDSEELQKFAGEVTRISHGSMRIEQTTLWHKGDTHNESDLVRYVQAGKADLGVAPARAWHGLAVRSFDALIAPMAVDSLALQQRVLESDLAGQMLQGTKALDLDGIGILPGPMRKPVGATRKLLGPADYKGADIAISESAVASRSLESLGAKAVPFPFQGSPIDRFDGIEQQIASVAGNQYDDAAASVTANVNLWPRPLVLFANSKAFEALPEAKRETLRQAARAAVSATADLQRQGEDMAVGELCRRGKITFVNASAAQIRKLRGAFGPVYTWLRQDRQTRAFLERIGSVRTGLASAAAETPSPSCPGGGQAGASRPNARTPVDGVYQVTTTLAEASAISPDKTDVPENYGAWTYVFDRGRFAVTQENMAKGACTWGYGTFVVKGNQFEWTFTDGGGMAPSPAANKPGEFFVFGWSLYRDTLTLTPVAGQISPENFRVKPWRRVSTTPSTRYLSKQCPPPAAAFER